MDNLLLVTVNILSFNRREELRNTLTKVYEQDYKNIEVIVVDNASDDGTVEMVEKEFPDANLIKLDKNIGVAGWNEGFKIAKGEYILVLDDDSYPTEKSIYNAVRALRSDDKIAIIAFSIFNRISKTFENLQKNGEVLSFTGCGAIVRNATIRKVGGYEELLFLYYNEAELSMRVINLGYKIYQLESCIVIHEFSNKNRKLNNKKNLDKRKVFYDTRNLLIILHLHFSIKNVILKSARIIAGRVIAGIKYFCFFSVLKGVFSYLLLIPDCIERKELLSGKTQKIYSNGSFSGGFFFGYGQFGLNRPKWLKNKSVEKQHT